ncbi:MAG: YraN family protein [Butyribacter sp.]|nr:YraN family protein [bacterium]MDY3853483.1 YraN family protein [Butyribacter sp.]
MGRNNKNFRENGKQYEQRAVAFLEKKGYQILENNFYSHYGEIDIIAKEKETVVFVEVKFRSNTKNGTAVEAVTKQKQQRLIKTAQYYLYCHAEYYETPCRFDVIAFENQTIRHLENAFEVE